MSQTDIIQHPSTLQPVEAGQPLTAKQLTARLALIQDVMRSVMKEDVDFGVIPGTPKPSLFKPGAEKLCVTFRLAADRPEVEQVPDYVGDIRYRVQVPIRSSDGTVIAVGIGECSTGEEKYRWRRPVHQNEFNAAPEDRKRQKFQRNGEVWNQVRVEPSDVANTVLKMAHKRAYVHGVIMATAAGSIFTQDIEDLPDGVETTDQSAKPKVDPPKRKEASQPSTAGTSTIRITVAGISSVKGTNDKGPWEKWTIRDAEGKKYGTFNNDHRTIFADAQEAGSPVDVTFVEGKYGRDVHAVSIVEQREPGSDG